MMKKKGIKKFRPKGILAFLYLLSSIVSTVSVITYAANTTCDVGMSALILLAALTGIHMLGTTMAAFTRKGARVWLLAIVQIISLLLHISTLAVSILELVAVQIGDSVEKLLVIVNQIRAFGGFSTFSTADADSIACISVIAGSFIALLHCIASFFLLSDLKGVYRDRLKTTGTLLFGWLSIVKALMITAAVSLVGWTCSDPTTLSADIIEIRSMNTVLSNTFEFAEYSIADWACLAWIITSVFSYAILALYAFVLRNKIITERRTRAEQSLAEVSNNEASESKEPTVPDLFWQEDTLTDSTASEHTSYYPSDEEVALRQREDNSDIFESVEGDFEPEDAINPASTSYGDIDGIINIEDAIVPDISRESLSLHSATQGIAYSQTNILASRIDAEQHVSETTEEQKDSHFHYVWDVDTDNSDEVDDEFACCGVPESCAEPILIPGSSVLDYGYSEDSII